MSETVVADGHQMIRRQGMVMVVVVEPTVVAGQLLATGTGHAGALLIGATTAAAGTQQTAGVLWHDDTGLAWSTPDRKSVV